MIKPRATAIRSFRVWLADGATRGRVSLDGYPNLRTLGVKTGKVRTQAGAKSLPGKDGMFRKVL